MPRILCLALFLAFIFQGPSVVAQATDAAPYPYNVDEVVSEFQARIENPTDTNVYLQEFIDESTFPALVSPLSQQDLDTLADWVKSYPALIEKLLIERKRNYDKYFNPYYKK